MNSANEPDLLKYLNKFTKIDKMINKEPTINKLNNETPPNVRDLLKYLDKFTKTSRYIYYILI